MAILLDRMCKNKMLVSEYLDIKNPTDKIDIDLGCFVVRCMHDNYLTAKARIQAAEETQRLKDEMESQRIRDKILSGL